jgi:hypothetical protein
MTPFGVRFDVGAFINMEISMMLKGRMTRTSLNIILLPLIYLLVNTISTPMLGNAENVLPSFADFSRLFQNDRADVLRGVYVANVLALTIVQQPTGDDTYVSDDNNRATQFAMASQYGNIGLLAHNYLSGKSFSQLTIGEEVRLVYGDGKVENFIVTEVLHYQALQPGSLLSSFRNLDNNEILSAGQMFARVYAGNYHVTFQTCTAKNGNSSWGRLFVIAVPKPKFFNFAHLNLPVLQ